MLPLGPCYINENWADAGMAVIIITRKHTNGNFTFAAFQVDLYCLGVRDASCEFNMHPLDFQEYRDKFSEFSDHEISLVEIGYPLAHNIIYGAIAYAEELGFKPGKAFDLVQYILEEDDDRVELIDVEFGLDGKPALISGSEAHTKATIAQLDRSVGKGNYTLILAEDFEEDLPDEEEMDDIPDFRDPDVIEHNIDRFNQLMSQLKETDSEDSQVELLDEATTLADMLFYTWYLPEGAFEEAEEEIMNRCDFEISDEQISNAVLFGTKSNPPNSSEIRKEVVKILSLREDKVTEGTLKKVSKLEKLYPDVPGIGYLKLKVLDLLEKVVKAREELERYLGLYPGYVPLHYMRARALMTDGTKEEGIALANSLADIDRAWPSTKEFCMEQALLHFHNLNSMYLITGKFHYVDALTEFFEDDYPELIPEGYPASVALLKMIFVSSLLKGGGSH